MNFELEFLEEFIKKECRKSKKLSSSFIIPDFSKKRLLIEQEVERIKKSFTAQLFQVENESRIELIIQHHQAHIIRLADKVAAVIDKEESLNLKVITASHTRLNLCKIFLQAFEALLNYIETHFIKYFDQDQKIPDTYAFISTKEFQEQLESIRRTFNDEKVENEFAQIVLFPINQFVNVPEKQGITFRRLIYLKYLAKELARLSHNRNANYSEKVYEHLFYLNFNSFHCLQYTISKIRREIEDLPSMTSQLEQLSLTIKRINQAQVKPAFALKPNRESLKSLLSNWLEEEIHFIEKKRQLTLMIPPGGIKIEKESEFKVKTILSVPQLAYSIRLLKDTGIITNENKSELIRFFSKNFSSAHAESISSYSFKGNYFRFERAAVTHVQSVLNKLLSHSKKDE